MEHADGLDVGSHAVNDHEGRPWYHQFARERHSSGPTHSRELPEALDGQTDTVQDSARGGGVVARAVIGLGIKGTQRCPQPSNAHDAGAAVS
jgi:hypothetical protein